MEITDPKDLSDDELKKRWFGALADFPTTDPQELNELHEELQRRKGIDPRPHTDEEALAARDAEEERARGDRVPDKGELAAREAKAEEPTPPDVQAEEAIAVRQEEEHAHSDATDNAHEHERRAEEAALAQNASSLERDAEEAAEAQKL
jgi:hypothetical protein